MVTRKYTGSVTQYQGRSGHVCRTWLSRLLSARQSSYFKYVIVAALVIFVINLVGSRDHLHIRKMTSTVTAPPGSLQMIPNTTPEVFAPRNTVAMPMFETEQTTARLTTHRDPAVKSISSSEAPAPHRRGPPVNQTRVILFTYLRGGSSFLGDLFNHHPDVFYWFEPLAAVWDVLFGGDGRLVTAHSDMEFFRKTLASEDVGLMLKTLDSILHCRLESLPSPLYSHKFVMAWNWNKSTKMVPYRQCVDFSTPKSKTHPQLRSDLMKRLNERRMKHMKHHHFLADRIMRKHPHDEGEHPRSLRLDPTRHMGHHDYDELLHRRLVGSSRSGLRFATDFTDQTRSGKILKRVRVKPYNNMTSFTSSQKQCLPVMMKSCSSSSIRVIKTIRLRFGLVADLLRRDPQLKVVFQMRDPRGVYNSRVTSRGLRHAYASTVSTFNLEMTALCRQMEEDVMAYTRLKKLYPNNVLFMKYEELSESPLTVLRMLYSFLNHAIPKSLETWVKQSTHANRDNGVIGTSRANSSATAYHWKSTMPSPLKLRAKEICKDALKILNYFPD